MTGAKGKYIKINNKWYNKFMDGSLIMMVFLITMLVLLLVAAAVIIMYMIKINKEVKKIAKTTEKSSRDISEFANLISSISAPLMIFSTLTSIIGRFGKNISKSKKEKK